jgi:predicted Rossmann-fold nucleotide-binding protein
MINLVACIGSRDLNKHELEICKAYGQALAENGKMVITGNARGADQAYAEGANSVDPGKVILVLPWYSYERHAIVEGNKVIVFDPKKPECIGWRLEAEKLHPAWHKLSQGGQLLMARNIRIVMYADYLIAFPKKNKYGQLGGTGQGIRYAEKLGMRIERLDES